jgi:head-tail adaptor
MPIIRRAGARRHQVALQAITNRAALGEGYVDTWTTYATVYAAIMPATASQVERSTSQTLQTPISHLVETDYRADVTTAHRLQFGTRYLYIRGLQNIDERNWTLMLACEERT